MKRSISSLFLITMLLGAGIVHAERKVVVKDQAVFRIENSVMFLTDVKRYVGNLRIFRCLLPKAMILKELELDRNSVENLPRLKNISMDLNSEAPFFYKIINLIKIQRFVERQKVVLPKNVINSIKNARCISANWSNWNDNLKAMVVIEAYFQDRFKEESSTAKSKKMNAAGSSVELFLITIYKKFKHNVYF